MFRRAAAFFWGFIGILLLLGLAAAVGIIIVVIGSILMFLGSIIAYVMVKAANGDEEDLFASKCMIVISAIIMIGVLAFCFIFFR